ncbi:hypothetical protein HMN09_01078300 [Mycena chlorophos]|uniref:Uncharacterized protein n=1 Tax=Mycena chlorophos TaxID=658473 RepID=A0A8H6SD15_MYCCL|nr:hypothetical protein HMN09_01078300 [Mycena chlorophos]
MSERAQMRGQPALSQSSPQDAIGERLLGSPLRERLPTRCSLLRVLLPIVLDLANSHNGYRSEHSCVRNFATSSEQSSWVDKHTRFFTYPPASNTHSPCRTLPPTPFIPQPPKPSAYRANGRLFSLRPDRHLCTCGHEASRRRQPSRPSYSGGL